MKKLILPILLLAAGCKPAPPPTSTVTDTGTILVHTYEGHTYLSVGGHSSLIHSESCTNSACVPITMEQLRNPMNFITPAAAGDPWNFEHLSTKLPGNIGEARK